MSPSRVIFGMWLLAASSEAFAPTSSLGAVAARRPAATLLSTSLRAESPRGVAQDAIVSYAGSKEDCRSFNRASFNRHKFSRQGSNAEAPVLRPQAAFMEQLATVPLDLVDGGMASAYGFTTKALPVSAPSKANKQ